MYKLTPSDFGYVLEECKFCFYQKVKFNVKHSGTFPSMFGYINSLLQKSVLGMDLSDVHSSFPEGFIESQEGSVQSLPIISAENYFIQGRYDLLVRQKDGTYILIDFKITPPEDEKIQKKYGSQLHAYKYALENPANGKEPITVSRLAVISVNPEAIRARDGKIFFTTQPTWHEIPVDMDNFFYLVKEISGILGGPVPVPSEKCKLCIYRNHFSIGPDIAKSQDPVPDLPF